MTDEIRSIRKYFRPIQPSIKLADQFISYTEFKPSLKLQDYIFCYWELKTKKSLNTKFKYRVVSDGCIDIFLDANKPEESYIMGFSKKYTEFELDKEFYYIGIRFLPSFFSVLFNTNAKILSNKFQKLKNVNSQLALWVQNIEIDKNFIQPFNEKMESFLENSSLENMDNRFYKAVFEILRKKGNIDLEKENFTSLSSRQLQRIFNKYIGTTPKSFANVVRFQHILNAKPSKQSLKDNKIYYDVGFYDQAHFIKSFKTFYGVTPTEAFN